MRHLFLVPLLRWLGRLSYPRMFMATAFLFALSLLIPDPIPLVDELLLGLGTLLLARLKRGRKVAPDDAGEPPIEGRATRHT